MDIQVLATYINSIHIAMASIAVIIVSVFVALRVHTIATAIIRKLD